MNHTFSGSGCSRSASSHVGAGSSCKSARAPTDSPFWDHPGVVLTPHSSAGGLARHGRVVDLFVENFERYRKGQALLHEVRPATGEATQTWLDERAGS